MKCSTVLLTLAVFTFANAASLPPQLTKCPLGDDTCLAKAIDDALKEFASGFRQLGVPVLDPLAVESLSIEKGQSAVNVDQNYKNVKVRGLTSSVIKKASYNDAEKTLTMDLDALGDVTMEGDYVLKGKILLLPVEGNGHFLITLKGMDVKNVMKFKEVEKNGKTYLEIEDYKLVLNPKQVIFEFDNLFNGNKELSDVLHKTVNENWEPVFEDVRQGYQDSFALIFKQLGNQVFSKIPKEEIFS